MPNSPIDKTIREGLKAQSKIVAIVIRNAMEDFHCKHLSDAQMKELNPLIRNAVYTALYSLEYYKQSKKAAAFLESQMRMIPGYWEEPEMLVKLEE